MQVTPRPGKITSYADPNGGISAPTGIIMAPDGDAWFTSIGNHRVGRVRTSSGIKGDGGTLLWFTNKRGNTIASIVCR